MESKLLQLCGAALKALSTNWVKRRYWGSLVPSLDDLAGSLTSWASGLNLTVPLAPINGNSLWHTVSFQCNSNVEPVGHLPLVLLDHIPSHFSSSDHLCVTPLTSLATWWLKVHLDWRIAFSLLPVVFMERGDLTASCQCGNWGHVLEELKRIHVSMYVQGLLLECKIPHFCVFIGILIENIEIEFS